MPLWPARCQTLAASPRQGGWGWQAAGGCSPGGRWRVGDSAFLGSFLRVRSRQAVGTLARSTRAAV
uniref:Uncharacterized protein n=1 Tax=Arundo donax TaxID=35708 RepID=A0A0A9BEE5_ARUDO